VLTDLSLGSFPLLKKQAGVRKKERRWRQTHAQW